MYYVKMSFSEKQLKNIFNIVNTVISFLRNIFLKFIYRILYIFKQNIQFFILLHNRFFESKQQVLILFVISSMYLKN